MDRALIHRLAAEAAASWSGRSIERVLPRPGGGLALLPRDPEAPALDLAPVPPRSWLAATGIRLQAAAGPASPGQAALVQALSGRVLGAITLLAGERIARLELATGSALMVELLGGAGNLFLVSPQGLVEITLRQVQRPGGALAVGSAWRPPVRPGAGEAATIVVWEAAGDESLPSAPGLAAAGSTAALELLDAQAVASLQIRPDGPAPPPAIFEPARFLGDAVLRCAWLRERHLVARQQLAEWRRRLAREGRRLERLEARQEREEQEARGETGVRRRAEALAAGLRQARQDGLTLTVADPYGVPDATVTINLNPGESPRGAMDRLFRRAGRLERAQVRIAGNLSVTRRRRQEVARMREAAAALGRETDLAQALASAPDWLRGRSLGQPRARPARPGGGKRRAADPRERKVRRYQLPGPWTLLVGGQADVNDYVSFRLAAPADFWLHVADYPGAHVVVRNPRRVADPPTEILRQAAQVAAWFSKARGRGPVDVRWTQARYLRKGKGLPVGMVLLPRFSTITVEAAEPPRPPAP